jgi:hypothetical protein
MNPRHPLRLLAALALTALLAAGCGNDDSAQAPAADPPTTTTAADDHDDADDDHGHDGGGEEGAVEVAEPALRLLVADSTSGEIVVLDLATGEEIGHVDVAGPARLYTEPHGRYVVAAQRDHDRVDWIDGGAWTVDHADHAHYWAAAPTVVSEWHVDGPQPTHVVFHHDLLAVFNDGDGSFWALDTHHLGDDDALLGTWDTGVAHHGVAVALEDLGVIVVSIPGDDPDDTLPIGVAVIDLGTGEEIDRFENCPGLHGEFATDEIIAFGCSDGVLLVEPHGDHWHADKVDRPAGTPDDVRTGTLTGGHDLDYLIGNLGSDALVRIDLDTETATAIPLPLPAAAWSFDAEREQIVVLTVDGSLHLIDPASREVVDSIEATDAIELPQGHGGGPRPSILVAGTRAYVSDPANEQVIEVAIDGELRVARAFDVGFAPLSLAVAGMASH